MSVYFTSLGQMLRFQARRQWHWTLNPTRRRGFISTDSARLVNDLIANLMMSLCRSGWKASFVEHSWTPWKWLSSSLRFASCRRTLLSHSYQLFVKGFEESSEPLSRLFMRLIPGVEGFRMRDGVLVHSACSDSRDFPSPQAPSYSSCLSSQQS